VGEELTAGDARDLVVYEAGLWEATNTHAGANSAYRIVEGGAASPNVLSELGAWTMRTFRMMVDRRFEEADHLHLLPTSEEEMAGDIRETREGGVRHPGARGPDAWRACKHSGGGTLMDAWLGGLLSKTTSCLFPPFLARCPMPQASSRG
jgi:hypothetical protein